MHFTYSWIYLGILAIAIAVQMYSTENPSTIAPFRMLFNFVVSHRVSRFALLVIWWWLGWHFLGSLQPI